MSFAALDYLPFLALVLGVFQFVPRRGRALCLLLASAAFYLYSSVGHAAILFGSIAFNDLCGRRIETMREAGRGRFLVILGVVCNVALLCVFKYGGFLTDTVNTLTGQRTGLSWPELALPLGISFTTFQSIGYLIDVGRGRIQACRNPVELALYISFFPQLVAGPIERAGHLLPQLKRLSVLTLANALPGVRLIVWGLFKKWVLADTLRQAVWPIFGEPEKHDSLTLGLVALSLAALLYFDFSAYTDIARGSARLFGVELVPNFQRTFAARSMSEFTQRWHMSLYTWIRDYAFDALARGPMSHARIWRNNLLVMALFGLWHRASWAFVLWGIAGGIAISVEHSWRLAQAARGVRPKRRSLADPVGLLGRAWVLCWSGLMFVLFFSPDLAFAGTFYRELFTAGLGGFELTPFVAWTAPLLLLGLVLQIVSEEVDLEQVWQGLVVPLQIALLVAFGGLTFWLRVPDPLPFIYFQF